MRDFSFRTGINDIEHRLDRLERATFPPRDERPPPPRHPSVLDLPPPAAAEAITGDGALASFCAGARGLSVLSTASAALTDMLADDVLAAGVGGMGGGMGGGSGSGTDSDEREHKRRRTDADADADADVV